MRRFNLERDEDATGVSGVGVVAQGVEFDDGSCAMRWLTERSSTAIYASSEDLVAIHGHGGRTRLVWLDERRRQRFGTNPVVPYNATLDRARSLGRRSEIIARLRRS